MNQKKTRKKRKKNLYFTKVHENAVIEYARSTDLRRKTVLYETLLQAAFSEMVDKIVYTYKFVTLPNIDELRQECKIWLTTILDKFDPDKGHKAFSYFSVITKNWFIQQVKKNAKRARREVNYENVYHQIENRQFVTYNPYHSSREKDEFWTTLLNELEDWKQLDLKTNERKVLLAIEDLLSNIEDIEIFNKKAIYLYLREISGLNTKQIVSGLSNIRKRYAEFKKGWNDGEV
jgi:DNA-directed RNA polymerase specialized sigma subunit